MNKTLQRNTLYSRIAGSIFGGAIGDALGGPVEGWSEEMITQHYGGPIKTFEPYDKARMGAANLSAEAGTYTDDTRLKNILCHAIITKKGRVTAEDLARAWLERMDPAVFFPTEQQVLHKIRTRDLIERMSKVLPAHKEFYSGMVAREFGVGNLAADDACMSISPIGIINAFHPAQAAQDAWDVALLFQQGYSASSCAPIAAAVADALRPDATWQSVVAIACGHADACSAWCLGQALKTAQEASGDEHRFRTLYHERHLVTFVDPMEVLGAVFGIFSTCEGDYRRCVLAAANFGRDCDTIAGIVGSIAGALEGIEAIPEEWVEAVRRANPEPDLDVQVQGLYEALRENVRQDGGRIEALKAALDDQEAP